MASERRGAADTGSGARVGERAGAGVVCSTSAATGYACAIAGGGNAGTRRECADGGGERGCTRVGGANDGGGHGATAESAGVCGRCAGLCGVGAGVQLCVYAAGRQELEAAAGGIRRRECFAADSEGV